MFIKMSCVWIF